MGIASDLSDIKDVSDTIVANKVSKFCYTDTAYTNNDADGVNAYNVNNEQNIPVGTPSIMKVNETVVTKGWRARASSITRMFMNHMLGRLSYNVNKLSDMFDSLLTALSGNLGTANGIATLDSNTLLDNSQLPKSNVAVENGTKAFTSGGAYDYSLGSVNAKKWLSKVFGDRFCDTWKLSTTPQMANVGIIKIMWLNGIWLAGTGKHGTSIGEGALWSDDGKTWSKCTGLPVEPITTFAYANGIWLAGIGDKQLIHSYTDFGLYWSENGKDWTQATVSGGITGNVLDILYAGNKWVASCEGIILQSNDGKTWDSVANLGNRIYSIAYNGTRFVAGVHDESVYTLLWSDDCVNWTRASTGLMSNVWKIKYVNGLWQAIGFNSNDGIWWSEDGKAWAQNGGNGWSFGLARDVIYANGAWYCSGNIITKSTDGKTWSAVPDTPTLTYAWELCYANGVFVIAGGQKLLVTKDFATFSEKIPLSFLLPAFRCQSVAYHDGTWVVGSEERDIGYSGLDILLEDEYFTD